MGCDTAHFAYPKTETPTCLAAPVRVIVSFETAWLQDYSTTWHMNDFLTTISSDHTALWALSVTVVVLALALVLHGFWDTAPRLLAAVWRGKKNPKAKGADDVVP